MPIIPQISWLSEKCLLIQFHSEMSLEVNQLIHTKAAKFRQANIAGLQDIIPAYDSLVLEFSDKVLLQNPGVDLGAIQQILMEPEAVKPENAAAAEVFSIPVCYDTALENDLISISAATSLKVDEIIDLHSSSAYQVYMLGFLPGFAYMGKVNEKLSMPRKSVPGPIKAGAVAIAGVQTGIYPLSSPGGWNVVGYTPLQLFNKENDEPTLLKPGMWVRFEPIDLETYYKMSAL